MSLGNARLYLDGQLVAGPRVLAALPELRELRELPSSCLSI